ncbi:MAG: deoxyribose-phosphate aldolase [Bacilli bacterium]|nr:deoxyribose-phosphate aldolase [Bacilli bacterium]MBO6286351.1 deoxyribose-phosphate aldolase [Bacilli bacterium]
MELNRYFDHTLLKPDATSAGIEKLCAEAKQYQFASVCVNPDFVSLAAKLLKDSGVAVCTVIGFPLGANVPEIKALEAKRAVLDGATEVDMVINVSKAKDGDFDYVEKEIRLIKESIGNILLKVILETCLLTDEEIVKACIASKNAGADYVKTSTGFSKGGATVHAVKLMRETVGQDLGVKASGGIHTKEEALAMIEAGASRIGASASVAIMNE